MTATRPPPITLEGRAIRLEPLAKSALSELYDAIALPEVFAGGYGGGPACLPVDREAFLAFGERSQ